MGLNTVAKNLIATMILFPKQVDGHQPTNQGRMNDKLLPTDLEFIKKKPFICAISF